MVMKTWVQLSSFNGASIYVYLIALGVLWVSLVGCRDQDAASDLLPPPQVKQEGGAVTFLWSDITTLDPHLVQDARSAQVTLEIFNGLVAYRNDMSIMPELASGWEMRAGGTEYIFSIKDGVTFHDGRPLTAQDVKRSIERATDPALRSPTASIYLDDILGVRKKILGDQSHVAGVEVVDEHRVKFTLDQPKPYFLGKMTSPVAAVVDTFGIVPDELRKPLQSFNGTGPFMLTEWLPEEHIILTRNQDYIEDGPFIDQAMYVFDGDGMAMYENNEIDIMELSPGRIKIMRDHEDPLRVEMVVGEPAFQFAYIGFNVLAPPFDDAYLRRALFYSVNKRYIETEVKQGTVVAAQRILPPGFPAHNEDVRGLQYDPDLARKLLGKSQYGEGLKDFPMMIMTLPGTNGALQESFRVITDTWKQDLGITIKVRQTEWPVYLNDLNSRSLQMFGGLSWNADYIDPHNFLDTLFHSESSMNHTAYHNADVDLVLEEARVEEDSTLRLALYQQAETAILEDAPIIPLWFPLEGGFLVKPRIQGYFVPVMPMQILRYIWIQQ